MKKCGVKCCSLKKGEKVKWYEFGKRISKGIRGGFVGGWRKLGSRQYGFGKKRNAVQAIKATGNNQHGNLADQKQ